MSAIERDREIAAKAALGRLVFDGQVYIREEDDYIDSVCSIQSSSIPNWRERAEHIVRLHNRQPLYDALVDAVRRMLFFESDGLPEFDDRTFQERVKDRISAIRRAYMALDAEQEGAE